jgi:hypothetical protein
VPDLPERTTDAPARTSAGLPRTSDAYHGSYNDYLWQLALADGAVPDVRLPGGPDAGQIADATSDPREQRATAPSEGRTVEGVPVEPTHDEQDG